MRVVVDVVEVQALFDGEDVLVVRMLRCGSANKDSEERKSGRDIIQTELPDDGFERVCGF